MKHYQGAYMPLLYPGSDQRCFCHPLPSTRKSPAELETTPCIFCTLAERFCRLPSQLLCCAVCRSNTVPDIPQSSINPPDWNRSTRCALHAANNLGDRAAIARAQIVCTERLRTIKGGRERRAPAVSLAVRRWRKAPISAAVPSIPADSD